MKKMFLSVVAIAASLNLMALTPTATAVITVTGDVSGDFDRVTLVESTTDGFSNGYENGYDVFQPELNIPGLYAICGTNRFSTSMTNNLDNNLLGFYAGTDGSYTMTFSGVTGRTLKLYDKVTKTETVLVNDGTYQFSAAASTRIDDRFFINYDPNGLDVCFISNKLTINSNPYTEEIVIKDANGAAVSGSPFAANLTEIDLSNAETYPNGNYTVEFGGGAKNFVVVVKH